MAEEQDGYDCFDEYDGYGDYSVNQATRGGGGGGGGGKSKTEKRHNKRGGGCVNVYSSKHIRAMEAQRTQQRK